MALQLDRLVSVSTRPNITIEIIPFAAEVPEAPLNTFTAYDDRLVTAETVAGLVVMRDPRDIALHLEMFGFFQEHALSGDPARDLLGRIAAQFRGQAQSQGL